jgi:hypothetical protein
MQIDRWITDSAQTYALLVASADEGQARA